MCALSQTSGSSSRTVCTESASIPRSIYLLMHGELPTISERHRWYADLLAAIRESYQEVPACTH